jgi:hypothetical protein
MVTDVGSSDDAEPKEKRKRKKATGGIGRTVVSVPEMVTGCPRRFVLELVAGWSIDIHSLSLLKRSAATLFALRDSVPRLVSQSELPGHPAFGMEFLSSSMSSAYGYQWAKIARALD